MAEINQYLYKIHPSRPEMLSDGATPEEEAIVAEHFEYLKELLAQGVLILAGRTLNSDPTGFTSSFLRLVHCLGRSTSWKMTRR